MDASHKTNDRDMPFYAVTAIDGNGESQMVCSFLVQTEDEESIRTMIRLFKDRNPNWINTKVVLTDKAVVERNVIKMELPNAQIQLCLYHVLHSFKREVTTEKMRIKAGERDTILRQLSELSYSQNELEYLDKYNSFCDNVPDSVRVYYDRQWHSIREQWVDGLKNQHMNLCNRTTNRVESFFKTLKGSFSTRGTLQNLIEKFMSILSIIRNERHYRMVSTTSKVSTLSETVPALCSYQSLLTPYSFSIVKEQYKLSHEYEIVDENTVPSKNGNKIVTNQSCECSFFNSMQLPCRHIFAMLSYKDVDLYQPQLVHERWTVDYFQLNVQIRQSKAGVSVTSQQTPKRRVLSEGEKFRKCNIIAQQLASCIAKSGMPEYERKYDTLKQLLSFWQEGKSVQLVEVAIGLPKTKKAKIGPQAFINKSKK